MFHQLKSLRLIEIKHKGANELTEYHEDKILGETIGEIKKLSLAIEELRNEMKTIRKTQERSLSATMSSPIDRSVFSWAAISKEAILGSDPLILPTNSSRETLQSTIEALEQNPQGSTADEISEITGRARNTESAYLRRLHLAGKVEKIRDKRYVKYKLA